jgi:hypothetical protein
VAGLAAGVAIGVIALIAAAIFLWYRKPNLVSICLRKSGNDHFDKEHRNDNHSQEDETRGFGVTTSSRNSGESWRETRKRAEDLASNSVLSIQERKSTSSSSDPSDPDIHNELLRGSSQGFAPRNRHEISESPLSDFQREGISNQVHAKGFNIHKGASTKDNQQSCQDQGAQVFTSAMVLTAPDPDREVVRAQQQWMLEKNAAEHAQRQTDAEIAVATTAAPVGASNITGGLQVPEDYELLKAQVVMLQQHVEEMRAASSRGKETEDELPPAYEGQRLRS